MKIALLGSAPSSVGLAPFADPSWQIWACSPGTYYRMPRCDEFFELHRWEPGVIGKADTQKPWFSPEYCAWMAKQKLVWMAAAVPDVPGSKPLPFDELCRRWGTYFWTSSLAYMIAMALNRIIEARKARTVHEDDQIGLWGVDMSASEEYGYQRAGCQHFLCMANMLGIGVMVPAESDLLRPMPPYGLIESQHWHIKNLTRLNELTTRLRGAEQQVSASIESKNFLRGAIDDLKYQMDTWGDDRQGIAPDPELITLMAKWGVPAAQQAEAPPAPPAPPVHKKAARKPAKKKRR